MSVEARYDRHYGCIAVEASTAEETEYLTVEETDKLINDLTLAKNWACESHIISFEELEVGDEYQVPQGSLYMCRENPVLLEQERWDRTVKVTNHDGTVFGPKGMPVKLIHRNKPA